MRAQSLFAVAVLFAAASPALAQSISLGDQSCVPVERNAVVRATATGGVPGGAARLYFRWKAHGDYYWLAMEPDGGGRFWTALPKPEKRNEMVEEYAALVDDGGHEIARSEAKAVQVTRDCRADLTPKETGVARNLTISETVAMQQGKDVLGFLCDGIVTRVNVAGIRRADEVCRTCVVAWWQKREVLLPLAAAGGVTTIITHPPEPSPSRP